MVKISYVILLRLILSTALIAAQFTCFASHKQVQKATVSSTNRLNQRTSTTAVQQKTAAAQTNAQIKTAKSLNADQKSAKSKQANADHLLAMQLSQETNGKGKAKQVTLSVAAQPSTALPNNVHYLKAIQQKGNSCGYHAIINAWAIAELYKAGSPINAESIMKQAHEKAHLIPEKAAMLHSMEITRKLNYGLLDIPNLYYLTDDNVLEIPESYNRHRQVTPSECFNEIKTKANACTFIISQVQAHWILIAAVKRNNQAQILVLDSQNAALEANRTARINFVAKQIA